MTGRIGAEGTQALSVPADWAGITPEWMTVALSRRFPGAEVDAVTLVTNDSGSNRRARFGLTYAAGSGPARVFVKAEGVHREVHHRNGNLFNEPELFASEVSLPVDHPDPYHVIVDRPGLDYLIVMEDVTERDADPRDATRPMTIAQVADGVTGLGRVHARYWGFTVEREPRLGWIRTWAPTAGFQEGLRRFTPRGLERAADFLPEEIRRLDGDAVVDLWARYVDLLDRDPVTLLHADAHIGNTYLLPGDRVGFLDWQVARRGSWSQDIAYFLVGALTVADRRRGEAGLIADYAAGLAVPAEQRPTSAQAWDHYRAAAAYGLAIWLSTLGTDGYQSREISRTLVERYAAAFVDLAAEEALARLESA